MKKQCSGAATLTLRFQNPLTTCAAHPPQAIITQGEEGEDFFIILTGECSVTIDGNEVGTLKEAEFFGEIALLTHKPRAATITAKSEVTCAKLDRTRFERVLGPCEDVLRRNMENYEKFKAEAK